MTTKERLDDIEKRLKNVEIAAVEQMKLELLKSEWHREVTETLEELSKAIEFLTGSTDSDTEKRYLS